MKKFEYDWFVTHDRKKFASEARATNGNKIAAALINHEATQQTTCWPIFTRDYSMDDDGVQTAFELILEEIGSSQRSLQRTQRGFLTNTT